MSFRRKLLVLILVFTALPLLFTGVLTHKLLKQSIYRQIEEDHYNLATATAEQVTYYLDNFRVRLSLSAKSGRFGENQNIRESLQFLKAYYPNLDYLYFVNEFGKVVASAPATDFNGDNDFSKREWFKQVLKTGEAYVSHSSIFSDANGKPVLFIATPVLNNNNKIIGVLGANISLENFNMLAGKLAFGETGKVIITDSSDLIIAHPDLAVVQGREKIATENIKKIKEFNVFSYNEGTNQIMVYKPLDFGWTVYVTQNEADVLEPLQSLQKQLVGILLITFISAMGAIFIVTRQFLQPIYALHEGAKQIQKGNFGYQVKVVSTDEVGYFSRAFNEMSLRLKGYMDDMKVKVQSGIRLYEFKQNFLDILFYNNSLLAERESLLLKQGLYKINEILNLDSSAIFWITENSLYSEVNLGIREEFFFGLKKYCKTMPKDYEGEVISVNQLQDHSLIALAFKHYPNPDFIIITSITIDGFKGFFVTVTSVSRNIITEDIRLLNTITQILSMVLEIDYQKEQNIKTNKKLNLIMDTISDGIITTDLKWRIMSVNEAFCGIFKASKEYLIGSSVQEFSENYLKNEKCILIDTLRYGREILDHEVSYLVKGERVSLLISSRILKRSNGETIGALAIVKNITKRKELEEQIRLSEKFSAIAQLAAGLAHEIKNPMTSIKGFMQLMVSGKDKLITKDHLDLMLRELDRINVLLSDFLRLAKPSNPQIVSCNLIEIVNEIITLKNPDFQTCEIEVETVGFDKLIPVAADLQQLKQVLMNVVFNAYEAMPSGGNLEIKASSKINLVKIEIRDSGEGIKENILFKIFDPFFTTKEYGTGLGLAISYQIMEKMGGKIYAYNNPNGTGATFVIEVPIYMENQ